MSTEFIGFQPPPGEALNDYDRSILPDDQPASVPPTFKEAMIVREEVFVKGQKVPLENELDEDDPRSYHWVAYASVGNASAPSTASDGPQLDRRQSTASRVAVGTIRLVPPPHDSHPLPGGSEHRESAVEKKEGQQSRGDSPPPPILLKQDSGMYRTPGEPYVKLGRLAVLAPYRGLGLSKLLINAAFNWAKEHPQDIVVPLAPAEAEALTQAGERAPMPWRGLVLVHAQTQVQKLWEGFGFVHDESMGTWVEEGIDHVGLWARIPVKSDGPKVPLYDT